MRRILSLAVVLSVSLALVLPAAAADKKLVVGSKAFTEQRLFGQILILLLERTGSRPRTRPVWAALWWCVRLWSTSRSTSASNIPAPAC
jgi:glycine betaine/choline ABC-type transport system substrate-binding protein